MKIGVYGNGLDSLITCHDLLSKGHHVEHFGRGERIAGHFAGKSDEHGTFDLGMVLLEKDVRHTPQRPLSEFSNEFGINARAYLAESYDFVEGAFGELRSRKVKTKLNNSDEIGDYFIADNLEFLQTLSDEELSSLQFRLSRLLNNQDSNFIHPRLKNEKANAVNDDLLTQLQVQYGPELADKLFGSFVNSLTGSKDFGLPIRFHRKLWIPLYFPESINAAISGNDPQISELSFLEFVDGSLASKIQELIKSISNNRRYTLNELRSEELRIENNRLDYQIFVTTVAEMSKIVRSQKIEGTAKRIAAEIVQGPRTEIGIMHFCVKKMENKTVNLQAPIESLFRYSITNGIVNDQSCISLEFGDPEKFAKIDVPSILGIVEPTIELVCSGTNQAVPFSPRYLNMTLQEWNSISAETISEFPGERYRVLPIHPDGSSFNDNLVRGLAASRGIGL
jgi:hypothetical protein